MKLHYSPESQFVRKVMATAIETGLLPKIEMIKDKKDLEKHNPLLKRPTLLTDDGEPIVDSPVICEYLDSLAGNKLLPKDGKERWKILSQMAVADGVMEAANAVKQDETFHKGSPSKEWADRQLLKVRQGMDAFEVEAKAGKLEKPTLGSLTVACCCGYLDYRHDRLKWRDGRPALAKWYESFSKRPAIAQTVPKAHA
jgi:glutathione S-transferase